MKTILNKSKSAACCFATFATITIILCGTLDADDRPNILWISCEDISPNLGCYGDEYASTPNLDALAKSGVRFDRAFTHAGVCAVLRSGVITGVYPISIGSQHMRSNIVPPPHIKCFPEYLRKQGYYCTNRSKTDYQFDSPPSAWDQQGNKHNDWSGRSEGQPFFSVINLTISHESQIRHGIDRHQQIIANLKPEQIHNPNLAGKFLPPYLPNTAASRQDWSFYADNISEMDRQVGEILNRLQKDGLADNTLVVFWGDHGQGMPRGKRWLYDSGTHVPLIMRWPGTIEANSVREDLVTLLDLAPTTLTTAGVKPPEYMVGRTLIGKAAGKEPEYLFFHRDRMDETYELIRGARDRNFKYFRNFEPERTWSQHIEYMDEMPTMKDWRSMNAEGKLNDKQKQWFADRKPIEELYDLRTDPHELYNLAGDPKHQQRLAKMRDAVANWQIEVGDLGMIPEPVLMQRMRPNGKKQRTARPKIKFVTKENGRMMRLDCDTDGATIEYQIKLKNNEGRFKIYTKPVDITDAVSVTVRANRLGFSNSEVVSAVILPNEEASEKKPKIEKQE